MATNNNGNLLDTSGNVFVDFAWGNFPMQPNDERTDGTAVEVVAANAAQNKSWTGYSVYPSARLNPSLSNHAVVEADYAGFPAFTGNDDGAYISGVAYVQVPNVLGLTTALALDALKDTGYEAASITTASATANAASTITAVTRTGTAATITSSGAGAKYPVGTKIVVSSLVSPNDVLNGTYTVTAVGTNTVSFTTTSTGALSTASLTVAGLVGLVGTIKTQSTAAGAASVATTATITVTPWAAAS